MMKRILPFVTVLLLFLSASAQPTPKANLFYRKGIELRNKNLFPEAMAAFSKAISLNKKFDSAYLEIGKLYLPQGKNDSAVANLKKAIAINPLLTEGHITLGNYYRDYKPNLDSALIFYSSALKLDSLNKITWYSIAWCYNAKGESEKAIPYAAKALDIDNNYRPAYNELGHAFHKTKNYTAAIEQFKKNMAISSVDLPYFYSGLCYIELNQKDGAMQMYGELQKINPKMAENLKKRIDAMK